MQMADHSKFHKILWLVSLELVCTAGYIEKAAPYFTSLSSVHRQETGSSVILQCHVEHIGSSILIWKKDARMISAGNKIIRKDSRMRLRGTSLEIDNISEEDTGQYICEVETFGTPINQIHTLQALVAPRVESVPSDGRTVVRKGSTITLQCKASGSPSPNVTWTRENNLLPSGELSIVTSSLTLKDVSRHHSGLYICTADNGVGRPAVSRIKLVALYPPEIEIEQSWIKDEDSILSEVSCMIYGEPSPQVRWFKETMLLEPTTNRNMETYGNRYVLLLRNIETKDFGNYSCRAENSLGKNSLDIEVSGRPHIAVITSPALSFSMVEYNLTWTVDSFIQILEYRVLFRVILKSDADSETKHTEWTNVVPTLGPDDMPSDNSSLTYSGSFQFRGLEPATHYQVIIQSRNSLGWSDRTPIFKYSTLSKDNDPRELELHKPVQETFSSTADYQDISTLCYIILASILLK